MTADRRPPTAGCPGGAGPQWATASTGYSISAVTGGAGWWRAAAFAARLIRRVRGAAGSRRAVAFAASLLVVAGCAEAPDAADTVAVDTIAGVVHVSNPADVPVWRAQEFVRIGATEAALGEPRPDELGRIENVAVGPDGAVYVADAYAGVVQVFGPDDVYRRTIGRKGGGPGEIEALQGIGVVGDTLVVLDAGNGRVGLFTLDGEWEGRLPWLALSGDRIGVFPAGPTEGYYLGPVTEPGQSLRLEYLRLTTAGPAGSVPRPERPEGVPSGYIRCEFAGVVVGSYEIPFAPRLAFAPGPGAVMAVAWTSRYEVAFVVEGDTTRVVRKAYEQVPTTVDAFEAGLQEYRDAVERFGRGDCDPASPDRPEHKPAIAGILFDQEGRLVVERHTPDGTAFDLYDGAGRIRATVAAPPRHDDVPPYFRDDRLYVVVEDSLGAQQVVGYRLGP